MHFDLSIQELVGLLATMIGAFWGMGKALIAQTNRQIDIQFAAISEMLQKQQEFDRRLERELMELKSSLPLEYVRREDYIRGQSLIEAKLDGLAQRIENWQLRISAGRKE